MGKMIRLPQPTDDLQVGDKIEHGITLEVDTGSGKAWIKYGVVSAVRGHETPSDAVSRVTDHVERKLEELIDAKS